MEVIDDTVNLQETLPKSFSKHKFRSSALPASFYAYNEKTIDCPSSPVEECDSDEGTDETKALSPYDKTTEAEISRMFRMKNDKTSDEVEESEDSMNARIAEEVQSSPVKAHPDEENRHDDYLCEIDDDAAVEDDTAQDSEQTQDDNTAQDTEQTKSDSTELDSEQTQDDITEQDCEQTQTHSTTRDVSTLKEREIRSCIRELLNDDTLQYSVKKWMQMISSHLMVSALPTEWTAFIKTVLMEEGEVSFSQTQSQQIVEDVEKSEVIEKEEGYSSSDDDDFGSGDEAVIENGEGAILSEKRASKFRKDGDEVENEELKAVKAIEKAELSARTLAVMELLKRDTEELESKADIMRNALLQRVKQKTQPKTEAFQSEVGALRQVKSSLKEKGLMDAFVVIAGEKGLKVADEEESKAPETKVIELSDDSSDECDSDEDSNSGMDDDKAVEKEDDVVRGGYCKGVVCVRGNNVRTKLKTQLQQNAMLQSSTTVAKKLRLSSSQDLVKVLSGIELERRRVAAERAAKEAAQREREERLEAERKERARRYHEELLLKQDDSEGEFDSSDEQFLVGLDAKKDMVTWDDIGDDDEEEDEDDDGDEEEALIEALNNEEETEGAEEEKNNEDTQEDETTTAVAVELAGEGGDVEITANGTSEISPADNDDKEKESSGITTKKDKSERRASAYYAMLKEEERAARKKKDNSKYLEEEAEEEEDIGRQAGLGDFGFGVPTNPDDEDKDDLRVRASDLENIVDDVSDGEGDEQEGQRQRLEDEARQDRLNTKEILKSLASGHKSNRQRNAEGGTRGHYGLDELAADGITNSDERVEDEDKVDFDDDEEFQAMYLKQMTSRVRGQKEESYAIDELTDDDDDDLSDDDGSGSKLTEDERRRRAELRAEEKKNYRRFFEIACMNRALRMERAQSDKEVGSVPKLSLSLTGDADAAPGLTPMIRTPSSSSLLGTPRGLTRSATVSNTLTATRPDTKMGLIDSSSRSSTHGNAGDAGMHKPDTGGVGVKRRTSIVPRKITPDSMPGGSKLRRVSSVGGLGPRASSMSGVLDRSELEAGHGMFMGVSISRRRQALHDSSSQDAGGSGSTAPPGETSLFAAVVGKRSGSTGTRPSHKRSFFGGLSKNKHTSALGGTAVTVSSQQYVFVDDGHSRSTVGGGLDERTSTADGRESTIGYGSTMDGSSRSGFAQNGKKRYRPADNISRRPMKAPSIKRAKSNPDVVGESSLFAKLTERVGPMAAKNSRPSSRASGTSRIVAD